MIPFLLGFTLLLSLGMPESVYAGGMGNCDFMDMSKELSASTTTDCCDVEDFPAEAHPAPPCDMDALCGCDSGQAAAKQLRTLPSVKNLAAIVPVRFQIGNQADNAAFISAPEGTVFFTSPPIFLLNSSFLN